MWDAGFLRREFFDLYRYQHHLVVFMALTELTDEEKAASCAAFRALGVCSQLAEAAAALGWKSPSPIQEQAIPHLLDGGPNQPPCIMTPE